MSLCNVVRSFGEDYDICDEEATIFYYDVYEHKTIPRCKYHGLGITSIDSIIEFNSEEEVLVFQVFSE